LPSPTKKPAPQPTEAEAEKDAATTDRPVKSWCSFNELYGKQETTEADRPSLQKSEERKWAVSCDRTNKKTLIQEAIIGRIRCTSCGKWRAVFGVVKLSAAEKAMLQDVCQSETDPYTCGAFLMDKESQHPLAS